MNPGTLYGIGIGPGDPDLITVKGAQLLSQCSQVVVPKASESADSLALQIIKKHLNPMAVVHKLAFPMTVRQDLLEARWHESAAYVASILFDGEDVCFSTLGDSFLYSTYIYLVRALRDASPSVRIVTIPGVAAFSVAAAITEFAVGEGKNPVTIVPTADDLTGLRDALRHRGTVVIMKIGKRLDAVLDLLEEHHAIETSVFASHVGMSDEQVETDLRRLKGCDQKAGYLSIILTKTGMEGLE